VYGEKWGRRVNTDEFRNIVKDYIRSVNGIIKLIIEFLKVIYTESKYIRVPHRQYFIISNDCDKIIIGDLHGDSETLYGIIFRENILYELENEDLVLIFLGDYIDRGISQVETLAAVYMLKILYPEKVVVLRGNHEPDPMLIPHPHDFPEELVLRYGSAWKAIYFAILGTFQKLPLIAHVPGEALLLHGGIPSRVWNAKSFEEGFSLLTPILDDEVIEDILWSDPLEANIIVQPSFRGAGKVFGARLTWRALRLAKVKMIIRGHEAIEGFKLNHRNRIVTLFTSKAPAYGFSEVAYLRIDDSITPKKIKNYIRWI